ncbi:MAG: hypothetical protein ABH848_00660 [Candidatus Omnitrophota bacterium]
MRERSTIKKEICPNCKREIIDDEALRCLYCGESLDRPFGFMGKIRYQKPKIMLVILIGVVLLCFFMFMR